MKILNIIIILLINVMTVCYGADTQKLVVLLDWFANPVHTPLFIAQSKGFFKEQGLDVKLIGPADPTDPPKLVAAGKADIAITYQPHFMIQVDRGLPLIQIGKLIDRPLSCLVVLKNGPIHTLKDLKGKKIGYSSSGMNSISLKVMLEKNNLSLHDVELVNVRYDLTQAVLSKKIDAVTGMMRNFELIQMELAGHPGRAFYPEENGIPTYSELIFVARNSELNNPKLKKFIIAVKKGIAYVQKHPDESWREFTQSHPELDNELNYRAWQLTLPYFTHKAESVDAKTWLHFAQFMQQNGLIKTVQPINKYAINLL